jgi:CBS domain-containing protein
MELDFTAARIRQVMTARPKTVRRTTSVQALRRLFVEYGFNAFPVIDDIDTLAGIVTKLDVLRIFRHDPIRLLPDVRALWAERVEDIMHRWVVTVTPGDPLTAAMDRMLSSRLRSVPVVDRERGRERLVGIVSCGDVLRAVTFETRDAG